MRLWSSTYERIWWPQPTSVLESSSFCCSSFCLRISCSNRRERSICQASSRLRCCERSFWHCTTMPVGMCVRRTAESVLLMCWPPAPEARKVSMRTSELQSPYVISYDVFCLRKKKEAPNDELQ